MALSKEKKKGCFYTEISPRFFLFDHHCTVLAFTVEFSPCQIPSLKCKIILREIVSRIEKSSKFRKFKLVNNAVIPITYNVDFTKNA